MSETHIERYTRLVTAHAAARAAEEDAVKAATVKAGQNGVFIRVCPSGSVPGFYLVKISGHHTDPSAHLTPEDLRAFAVSVIDLVDERLAEEETR